ncbi:putative lipoprotein YbaY [Pseudomonas nitritireducens]|uniref:Putative lipoprotein YbaY n=1 Tax=Pseudomonas nitroreducens TaxID=46680 RepID=A0A7W7KNE3_PSENT|nr:putative lipoprotein YbaY [Pseudomonas nitritireducens]
MFARLLCLSLPLLLAACASEKPAPVTQPVAVTKKATSALDEPVPAHLRALTGQLSSAQGFLPAGSEVELALLVIDQRDRPQQLLSSEKFTATGQALPFRVVFNPQSFPSGARVELHGRVSQSGQLAWRLSPIRITQPDNRALGELRLERAP